MSLRNAGTFQANSDEKSNEMRTKEIEKQYQDIKNNREAMETKISELGYAIESAKKGGCIRTSIMGPQPGLERQYTLQKQVLEKMLAEFKENNKLNATHLSPSP